MMATSKDNSY